MADEERKAFEKFLKTGNFREARQMLLPRITPAILKWNYVRLEGGHTVQVCSPARVEGPDGQMYYVPVTSSETWHFARMVKAFPLTSAVFDQYQNQAAYVEKSPNHNAGNGTVGMHFHTFSEYLNQNQYHVGMKSGAHKLWVLSFGGRSINHGFYAPKPKNPAKYLENCKKLTAGSCDRPGGPELDSSYWLRQFRGAKHNENHWDYSQLLQLMRSDEGFGLKVDTQDSLYKLPFGLPAVPRVKILSLQEALLAGLPEVWDENPNKLTPDMLPWR
jgi:hypothetical protein